MSKSKPSKQTLSYFLSAGCCLLALVPGLCMMQMAMTCGIAVGLGLSAFALVGQALIAATATPYIKRKIRPMLWTTVSVTLLFIVSYIAVDLCHLPVMDGGKYVGMGIALLVWECACLALAILLSITCLLATLHKNNEPAEVPEAPQQVDTDQLVAQAQDVVLRSKITVEEATPAQSVTRRAVSPQEVREVRAQTYSAPLPDEVYTAPKEAPVPPMHEEDADEAKVWMAHEKIKPIDPKPVEPKHIEANPILSNPIVPNPIEPQPEAESEEDWDGEEEEVIFAAQGAVDQDSGAPLRDNDIRAEFVGHHTRQKPQEKDDDLYTDFGYGEE